jgi:hypothetical protein
MYLVAYLIKVQEACQLHVSRLILAEACHLTSGNCALLNNYAPN